MKNTKSKINVAIIGVGNCASALVQGVDFYRDAPDGQAIEGINFSNIGGYKPGNINFVAAYDIDERKVGQKLSEAIFAKPNCCFEFHKEFSKYFRENSNPIVEVGPLFDGVAAHMGDYPEDEAFRPVEDGHAKSFDEIVASLKARKIDVLLNYLPVGSMVATKFWAQVCITAKIAMVNCIPVFIASDPTWADAFTKAGVPIIGDDMRSQFGASIVSAVLQELLFNRGHEVDVHYQDNVGGNTDFLNMQDDKRLVSKKKSKENVIVSQNALAGKEVKPNSIAAGPAKYFSSLGDNKRAHWLIKARGFGGAPVEFTADLSVQDSPNSAGVVIDAIRLVKVAQELGIVGPLYGPSAFTQKTPPIDMHTADARNECALLADGFIPDYYSMTETGLAFNQGMFFSNFEGASNIGDI